MEFLTRKRGKFEESFLTLKKHLIITKSEHKVSNPKSIKFLLKFLTIQAIFIVFLCIKFFQIKLFFIFLQLFL